MKFDEIEKSNSVGNTDGIIDGLDSIFKTGFLPEGNPEYDYISLRGVDADNVDCALCFLAKILPDKDALKRIVESQSQKSSSEAVIFSMCLLPPCYKCKHVKKVQLKNKIQDLLVFWCGQDQNKYLKVRCMIRFLRDEAQFFPPTLQLLLCFNTSSSKTLLVIPLTTMAEDESSLLHRTYAYVCNVKEKVFSLYIHEDFNNSLPKEAFTDSLYQVKNIFNDLERSLKTSILAHEKVRIVDKEKYLQLFLDLKRRYMEKILLNMSGEQNMMSKTFMYLSTAAFLLLLWKDERRKNKSKNKQSFVHVKCGGGVLVYLLNMEGHPGRGIDIERNIMWDRYLDETNDLGLGKKINLEVVPIIPHELKFSAEWIVAVEPEELTPWISIIAKNSSDKTNFFLLPCCNFGLHQTVLNCSKRTYMDYLTNIGCHYGFKMKEEKIFCGKFNTLRCLIGVGRVRKVAQSIEGEMMEYKALREYTTIDCSFKNKLHEEITSKLLLSSKFSFVNIRSLTSSGNKWSEWNAGGFIMYNELQGMLSADILKKSSEIESFLSQFFYLNDGKIYLKDYRRNAVMLHLRKDKAVDERKTSECWFHWNHPQGCVLHNDVCPDIHDIDELNVFARYC